MKNGNKVLVEKSVNIFEISNFLDQVECDKFINYSEKEGYDRADIQVSKTERKIIDDIRTNDRVLKIDEKMAETLWAKLKLYDLPKYRGRQSVGLSPYFRFYKYSAGQKFSLHRDGRQIVDGKKTLFTFMIYLNENFEGGATNFSRSGVDIQPEVGKALIFDHILLHQGCELVSGFKYVLRTDIVFGD